MKAEKLHSTSRLKVAPFYIIPEAEGFVVLHGRTSTMRVRASAASQIIEFLLPLLDGTRTRDQVITDASAHLPGERSSVMIEQLAKNGLVCALEEVPEHVGEVVAGRLEGMRKYFEAEDTAGWESIGKLRSSHVLIVNRSTISVPLLLNLLHMGLGAITMVGGDLVSESDASRMQVAQANDVGRPWGEVLAERVPFEKFQTTFVHHAQIPASEEEWENLLDDVTITAALVEGPSYFPDSFTALNRASLRTRKPWILVGNVQHIGLGVGPTFIPGSTPCLACFEARLKSNLHNLAIVELLERHDKNGGKHINFGEIAPGHDIAGNLAAMEIVDTIVDGRLAKTAGKLLTIDLRGYDFQLHNVLKVSRCPVCRPGATDNATRIWA